jgi:hypothetical protein
VKQHRFEAEAAVEFDLESAFDWYEAEERGLGLEFLERLRAAYLRILENTFGYQDYAPVFVALLLDNFPTPFTFQTKGRSS